MKYDPANDAHKIARELTIEMIRQGAAGGITGMPSTEKGKHFANFIAGLYDGLSEHFSKKE